MDLNGGYVMIDLDVTTDIYNRVLKAYNTKKPVIAYIDGIPEHVTLKYTSGSNIGVYTSTGVYYDVAFYGVITRKNIFNKYRHQVRISGSIGGTTRVLTVDMNFKDLNEPIVGQNRMLSIIKDYFNCDSSDSAVLVGDNVDISSLIYITGGSQLSLCTKPIGANTYSTNLNTTLTITDIVDILY